MKVQVRVWIWGIYLLYKLHMAKGNSVLTTLTKQSVYNILVLESSHVENCLFALKEFSVLILVSPPNPVYGITVDIRFSHTGISQSSYMWLS